MILIAKKIKGTVIVYLSEICELCQEIKEQKERTRELYLKYFDEVSFRDVNTNIEFLQYGFQALPVLILPGYRPFEAISPSHLMDEDSLVQMIDGRLLPEDVMHEKAIGRQVRGEIMNKNLEKLLGD